MSADEIQVIISEPEPIAITISESDQIEAPVLDLETIEVTILEPEAIEVTISEPEVIQVTITGAFPMGVEGENTGDIIRWNADSGAWESKAEPFYFDQIILNPLLAPLEDIEGGIFYKKTDNGVYVAVE